MWRVRNERRIIAPTGGRLAAGLGLVSVLLLLLGCRPALSPPVKVKVGGAGLSSDGGVYVAMARGYFQAEGLEVEYVPFNAGDPANALATNQIQFGSLAPNSAFYNAAARGAA